MEETGDHQGTLGAHDVSRRSLFQLAAAGLVGVGGGAMAPDVVQAAAQKLPLQFNPDGTYPVVALAKDSFTLGVVQSRVRQVDLARLAASRKENLDHMLDLIDASQGWGGIKDVLLFHEFPITGWSDKWSRADSLRAAIEIPGEETEAIGKKARQYGCYIVFGSYVRDRDWSNHLLSITTMIGPDGTIVDKHWKARNIKGVFGGQGYEIYTSTIHDCLDAYVEMYGRDAVLPVTRTPLGNFITSSVQREPELFRAFAMKGGEIHLRTATGGFTREDVLATSLYNRVWTAMANNAVSPNNPGFFDDSGAAGGSVIFDPSGKVVDEANSVHETILTARIPIAQMRRTHRQPVVHMSLYRDLFDAYVERYPPNLFTAYQPTDGRDAARYLVNKARWK
jgi:predicted amidohydrolase